MTQDKRTAAQRRAATGERAFLVRLPEPYAAKFDRLGREHGSRREFVMSCIDREGFDRDEIVAAIKPLPMLYDVETRPISAHEGKKHAKSSSKSNK